MAVSLLKLAGIALVFGPLVWWLTQAQGQHAQLGELAQQHQAQDAQDQGRVAQDVQQQNDGIRAKAAKEGGFPELQEPHLVMASPAGIASTTAGSTHQHSQQHHAVTTGGHTSLSVGGSLLASVKGAIRLFAHKAGLRLVSAQDLIEIQALKTSVNLLAKLDITHTANRITLTAKEEVVLNGGGSYTRWNAQGIESGTAGQWVAHAAKHALVNPANAPVTVDIPPVKASVSKQRTQLRLQLKRHPDETHVLTFEPYELLLNGSVVQSGVSDAQGWIVFDHEPGTTGYEVRLGSGVRYALQPKPAFKPEEAATRRASQGFRDRQGRDSLTDDYPPTVGA